MLFIIYTADVAGHGVRFHCYADDTQLHDSSVTADGPSSALTLLLLCIDDITRWVSLNHLKQNADKNPVQLA